MSAELTHASMVDAIACAISMIVAYSSLVGRIQPFEIAVMTLFGSWLYEVNSQLLWRFFMTDIGYGMRIFLFGSIVGIVSSVILGRKDTTVDHPYYMSVYSSRSLGLIGLVVAVCTFPLLVVGSLYQTSINYSYILFIATLNMYLAVGAGILGAFSASAIFNGKIFLHDLIFSGLAGGIVFSSSADLHRNPALPLAAGFIISFVVTSFHSKFLKKTNEKGVTFSLGHINMYLIPGLFSGILSGIMHGVNQGTLENYVMRRDPNRTLAQQGGYQILGVLLTIGIALFTGAILGGLFKAINKQNYYQQFDDNAIFELDRDDEKRYEDDGEIVGSSSNGE